MEKIISIILCLSLLLTSCSNELDNKNKSQINVQYYDYIKAPSIYDDMLKKMQKTL